MPVAIVADSAANIPAGLVDRHGIAVVPMILKFGDRELRDGVDIPEGGFYPALVEQKVPVSTSAPSPGDFAEAFGRALESADGVVCVTVASFVSASYEAAVAAAKEFGDRVRVVDSRSASMGEGFAALEAARMPAGAPLDEVAARAEEVARRTSLIATIDTFEFLRRSGRVNVVMAYAATTLNIKPVFGFRGGKLEQLGRPRTRARALDRVAAEVRAAATEGPLRLAIVHANAPEDAGKLRALLADVKTEEIVESEFTPLMGAHTGPGVVAAAFWGPGAPRAR
jgi:DegV family protein with EDD domain